jgi:hypothetical protein
MRLILLVLFQSLLTISSLANECWITTDMKGQLAFSDNGYNFVKDKFSKPIVICLNDDNTGSVSNDDTPFVKVGHSTLIGWVLNNGLELTEVYQIDRVNQKVLFTKSRIGTKTLIPTSPDVIGVFVGNIKKAVDKLQ